MTTTKSAPLTVAEAVKKHGMNSPEHFAALEAATARYRAASARRIHAARIAS